MVGILSPRNYILYSGGRSIQIIYLSMSTNTTMQQYSITSKSLHENSYDSKST